MLFLFFVTENGLSLNVKEGSIPTVVNETSFKKVNISNSEDVHIGPQFIASTINYIDFKSSKSPTIKYTLFKKRLHLKCIIPTIGAGILLIVGITILLCYLLPVRNYDQTSTDNRTESTPTSTTSTTTTTTMSPLPPVTPTPDLPKDWLVPYELWSPLKPPECTQLVNKTAWTVSVDKVQSCQNVDALKMLQNSSGLHHNFYVTENGKVYIAHGWSCASEFKVRYSKTNIIIAMCGTFNEYHKKAINALLLKGYTNLLIRQSFNLIPECCRAIPGKRGPGKEINDYLVSIAASEHIKFSNTQCIQNSHQCT